nr:prepilin-type N-terminal cleavage/methylation domain-containing protein [Rhodoferax sp.]
MGRPGGKTRPPRQPASFGFTLLELMVVVAIMALATAGVSLAMRDSSQTQLERDAQRLAALLESARAVSRMTANTVVWRATPNGFVFEGTLTAVQPTNWLGSDVVTTNTAAVVLGPEPIIGPQRIRLASISQPGRSVSVTTDGVRPFKVVADADAAPSTP